jgi:hypothetical protein
MNFQYPKFGSGAGQRPVAFGPRPVRIRSQSLGVGRRRNMDIALSPIRMSDRCSTRHPLATQQEEAQLLARYGDKTIDYSPCLFGPPGLGTRLSQSTVEFATAHALRHSSRGHKSQWLRGNVTSGPCSVSPLPFSTRPTLHLGVRLTTASVQPRVTWRTTVMDRIADPDAAFRDPAYPPNAAIRGIVALNTAYCPRIGARRAGRMHAGGG